MTRYTALLRVCDMACAFASEHGADQRPEFFDTLSAALEDDCPQQSQAATRAAHSLRLALGDRDALIQLLHAEAAER